MSICCHLIQALQNCNLLERCSLLRNIIQQLYPSWMRYSKLICCLLCLLHCCLFVLGTTLCFHNFQLNCCCFNKDRSLSTSLASTMPKLLHDVRKKGGRDSSGNMDNKGKEVEKEDEGNKGTADDKNISDDDAFCT